MLAHPSEIALCRAEWQHALFAERPSRLALAKLRANWPTIPPTIRVHRNHSFEHVADAARSWLFWQGRDPKFVYSDYDDSLSFGFSGTNAAELELVWLDLSHYANKLASAQLSDWLANRIAALRALSEAPILLAPLGADDPLWDELNGALRGIPGMRLADLRPISAILGDRFLDQRAARFSGTRLSDLACVLVAREFACRWCPALLQPRLKAIVLDLDHTLFDGVLGEDELQVKLTPSHAALQEFLVQARGDGVFLALVSRNEEADVRQLFRERADFPLRWEHFSARAIGWGSKAEGIRNVATQMRIGLDAILYVDDNPGELASVASELPMIATAHAMPDPASTRRMLEYYPTLWTWKRSATDVLRTVDLEMQTERARLAHEARDPMEYLRSLRVKIRIEITPRAYLPRLHELSQKTNQFNLNLMRYSELEIARALDAADCRVAIVGLTDRMSDSGQIALILARQNRETLEVREIAISCRALGRNLEDLIIAESIRAIRKELPSTEVRVFHRTGPRNGPARVWLERFCGIPLSAEGQVTVTESLARVSSELFPVNLEVVTNEHHGIETAP